MAKAPLANQTLFDFPKNNLKINIIYGTQNPYYPSHRIFWAAVQ